MYSRKHLHRSSCRKQQRYYDGVARNRANTHKKLPSISCLLESHWGIVNYKSEIWSIQSHVPWFKLLVAKDNFTGAVSVNLHGARPWHPRQRIRCECETPRRKAVASLLSSGE